MSAFVPDINTAPPPEDYRYYGVNGLPFGGQTDHMPIPEYRARTLTNIRVGFGNFDTARSDEQFFGRTLNEVLTKVQTGEYRMLIHREQWVQCEKFGVRVLQFVQWAEFSDRLRTDATSAMTRQPSAGSVPNNFLNGR